MLIILEKLHQIFEMYFFNPYNTCTSFYHWENNNDGEIKSFVNREYFVDNSINSYSIHVLKFLPKTHFVLGLLIPFNGFMEDNEMMVGSKTHIVTNAP